MMRWRPWPPQAVTKYQVRLVVRSLEAAEEGRRLAVEIRWKGPKARLGTLRRTVRRNFTREEEVRSDGVIAWEEEFHSVCNLSANKENAFSPWEIAFTVLNGFNQGTRAKVSSIGTASLNLAEYVSTLEGKEFEVTLPLTVSACSAETLPSLLVSLSLLELQIVEQPENSVPRSMVPVQSPLQSGETLTTEKDEFSAFKAGLRKVKTFKEYVSSRRGRKASRKDEGSEGRCTVRSDSECNSPFDSDSLDYFEDGESENGSEDSSVRKSISYGTLAEANCAGRSFYSTTRISGEVEDLIYYSSPKSDVRCLPVEESAASVSDQPLLQSSKSGILSWRKRKLSFRSPKAKGEPLLKKAYGEEGGDDIDFDRRQLSSDESNHSLWRRTDNDSIANRSSVSEFGDDSFAVGSWEMKEIVSRDGHWKLQTQVFFASIDQRSEQAAGESACTALVAVIANWLQSNRDVLPIKSQFDSLIREGSLEWRNLCENETYMERFPDKHFDLETVLQAKICHLSVAPQKSFIGFFHPEGIDEDRYEVLHGAMSFDSIWDEISCSASELLPCDGEPQVYVISWNDHFFVLKVEPEAYYIIDTLGERLFEGCKQAYILKFDRNTTIHELTCSPQSPGVRQSAVDSKSLRAQPKISKEGGSVSGAMDTKAEDSYHGEKEPVVCQGKASCKEYIKSFLAAIPIRELQADIKKGLMASTHLHQRLQIEFHYTQFLQPQSDTLTVEETVSETVDVAISDNAA